MNGHLWVGAERLQTLSLPIISGHQVDVDATIVLKIQAEVEGHSGKCPPVVKVCSSAPASENTQSQPACTENGRQCTCAFQKYSSCPLHHRLPPLHTVLKKPRPTLYYMTHRPGASTPWHSVYFDKLRNCRCAPSGENVLMPQPATTLPALRQGRNTSGIY